MWPAVSLQIKESGALSILLFQESACSIPMCLPREPGRGRGPGRARRVRKIGLLSCFLGS